MKIALASAVAILICSCSSVPDYTSRVDQKELPANEAVVHLDASNAIAPEVMSRVLMKEAARAAIDRGGVYFRVEKISIGPVVSTTAQPATERAEYGPSAYDRSANERSYRSNSGLTSTEAAVEATIIALLSSGRSEKQRSGSLHMTFGTELLPGPHVFDAGKVLDAVREGGDVKNAQP